MILGTQILQRSQEKYEIQLLVLLYDILQISKFYKET